MSSFTGLLTIDSVDAWDTYGVARLARTDDFIKFPARKKSVEIDYPDSDGLAVDLSSSYYEARKISLQIAIIGNNATDFWTKYTALFAALTAPGQRTIYIAQFQSSFSAFFTENSQATRLTTFSSGVVAMTMTLAFSETTPNVPRGTAPVVTTPLAKGMRGYILRDGTMWLIWGWNYKNLDGHYMVIGDSQYQGVNSFTHNPPGRFRDHLLTWINANHPTGKMSVIAKGGQGTIQMMPDGTNQYVFRAHNVSAGLQANPDIVIIGDDSNDFGGYLFEDMPIPPVLTPAQVVANKLYLQAWFESQGIPTFLSSVMPRTEFDQGNRNIVHNCYLLEVAQITDGSYFDYWQDVVSSDGLYTMLPAYDCGDGMHMVSAGNVIILNRLTAAMGNVLGTITGIAQYEIQYSLDNTNWIPFDTVTDQNVIKKQYTTGLPAYGTGMYFRMRSKTTGGVYSPYTNSALVSNNGYFLDVLFYFTAEQRFFPIGVNCHGDPYLGDTSFTDAVTGITLATKVAGWGGFGSSGSYDYNGELKDDGGGFFTGYPACQRESWYTGSINPCIIYISGLNPANQYRIYLLSTINQASATILNSNLNYVSTDFYVNSRYIGTCHACANTSQVVTHDFTPNSDGTFQFTMKPTINPGGLPNISCVGFKTIATPSEIPVANAGTNIHLTLPTNAVTLDGSASTPTIGYIRTWLWEKVVGAAVSMPNTGTSNCPVSGFIEGVWQFRLTVTNSFGYSASAYVVVTVDSAGGATLSRFAFSLNGPLVPGYVQCAADPSLAAHTFTDTRTSISVITLASEWNQFTGASAFDGDGANSGSDAGIYPDLVEQNFWISNSFIQMHVGGLTPGSSNRVRFYSSLSPAIAANFTHGRDQQYYINTVNIGSLGELNSNYNTYVEAYGTADGSGKLFLEVGSLGIGFGVLNVLEVQKAPGAGYLPVSNPGPNQYLYATSTTENGSASSTPFGSLVGWLWTILSGPTGYAITTPTANITTITSLVAGVYLVQLQVTNSSGYSQSKTNEIRIWPTSTKRTWYLDFKVSGASKTAGWEILAFDPGALGGATNTITHPSLGWTLQITGSDFTPFSGTTAYAGGPTTGSNSGFVPDSVMIDYWYGVSSGKTCDLLFNVGAVGVTVTVYIYAGVSTAVGAGEGGASGCLVSYYVNSVYAGQLNLYNNTSSYITASATSDSSGNVHIQSIGHQTAGTAFGIYNAIEISTG